MSLRALPSLPTLCRVCHRWQTRWLCAGCRVMAIEAPRRCARCALPLQTRWLNSQPERTLCLQCEDLPPVFDHALAAMDYAEPWSGLVTALKFRQDTALADGLAGLVAAAVRQRWQVEPRGAMRRTWRAGAPTLLVPMPLSPQRWRERGYNQAALLARGLGQRLALPVHADGLQRTQHTERLMRLDADARASAIAQAFRVPTEHAAALRGRHVALVDDVLTTGATANAAAKALWEAGAREVSVWVVARTPLPERHLAEEPSQHADGSVIDKIAIND